MLSFKSRRRRSRWSTRQSSRSRWLMAILLLASIPIGLEVMARLISAVTGFNQQAQEDPALQQRHGYQLQFTTDQGQPYDPEATEGELLAVRSPLLGYQLVSNRSNAFWTLNEQGFRDDEPVPREKPAGEIRIFVLGGTTAFGQLNSSNASTTAHQLEALLNERITQQRTSPETFQPVVLPYWADRVQAALARPPRIEDGQYRVINAAVPGYASGNELAQLMNQVVHYNPNIIVLLNGYADLLLPSSQIGADVPGLDALLQYEPPSVMSQLRDRLQRGIDRLAMVKIYKHYQQRSDAGQPILAEPLNIAAAEVKPSLNDYVGTSDTELQQRVVRYREHVNQIVQWASGTQNRVIIGVQPEITGRNADSLTPAETAIVAQLSDAYAQWMQTGYEQLNASANQAAQRSANAKAVNLYRLYDTFPNQAFHSPTSLTDEASTVLAQRLYEAIAAELSLEPVPFAGRNPR